MSTESEKKRRAKFRALGLCIQCGKTPATSRCTNCTTRGNRYNVERRKALKEKGLCACGRPCDRDTTKCLECKADNKTYVEKNRPRVRDLANLRYRKIKSECLSHYGRQCACCGEPEECFLQIDHIGGGGREHRASGVTSIFYWLKANNFPEGFQVLCANCNWAKRTEEHCPNRDTSCAAKRNKVQ